MDQCLEALKRSPLLLLGRVVVLLKAGARQAFAEEGGALSPEQWGVLHRLHEEQGLCQGELAQSLCKDKTTMVRILDSLEEMGLVARQRDCRDRRSFRIHPTAAGQEAWARLLPVVARFNSRVFSNLNPGDLLVMVQILEAMAEKLGGPDGCCRSWE